MGTWNIINLSDIRPDRADAEYFHIDYSENIEKLSLTGKITTIGRVFKKVERGEKAMYLKEGPIPVLRSVNIRELNFNEIRQEYVSTEYHADKTRGHVLKDDILITSTGTGTLGRTSIWPTDDKAFNVPENSFLRDPIEVDPYMVATFLNTDYGIKQLFQNQRGSSGQLHLYPVDIRRVIIPECLLAYQVEIGELVRQAFKLQSLSKELYQKANQILEQELGLDKISFKKQSTYIANYSEVATSRRMNAEFYSPVVKKILLSDSFSNSKPLSSSFQIIRGTTPKIYLESGIPVLKTKNIRIPEIDRSRVQDYVADSKKLTSIRKNDLLLASMGVGSLGRMSFIESLNEEGVVDGTIRVIRRKPETPINYEIPTLLFLTSKVGQDLIYRGIVGSTGIIALPDDYLAKIPIPEFKPELREKLTALVKNSIHANRKSKGLHKQAKTRVEDIIKQSILANAYMEGTYRNY